MEPLLASPPAFESPARPRLVVGPGTVERSGELTREWGARRVLLVTDPGLMAAGHGVRVQRLLEQAGLQVALFTAVRENPTTRCVEQCAAAARAAGVDSLIGLGGGSALDTAKGCNFLLTNGGRMQDYWGVGKARKAMLPLLAIPTTAGTGSECQSAALITDETTHQKMACLDPKAAARVAVLDPVLTLSQPPRITALTGMDALTHAVECAVTTKRNPFSLMYAHQAFALLCSGFPRVLQVPDDLDARAQMQLGAALAGLAIEHSMLGAAHAAANPLTAHYAMAHGAAVGLMMPGVVRFNAADPAARQGYAQLAHAAGLGVPGGDVSKTVEALIAELFRLRRLAQLPDSLADGAKPPTSVRQLAEEAAQQWTARFNPRPIGAGEFEELYHEVLGRAGR